MNKINSFSRKLSVIIGFVIIVAGIALGVFLIKNPKQKAPVTSNNDFEIPVVKTKTVELAAITPSHETTGKVNARNQVEVYADATGTLLASDNPFKKGVIVQKGDTLIQLDKREKELLIKSSKEDFYSLLVSLLPTIKSDYPESFQQWKDYVDNFSNTKSIATLPKPKSEQEKYFLAAKKVRNLYLSIKSSEANLEKYTILAPFNGVITKGELNPGTLIRAGQMLGELMELGKFEIQADIPLAEASIIHAGAPITITSDAFQQQLKANITRIGKIVDQNTQTIQFYTNINNRSVLKNGMFVNITVQLPQIENAFLINRKYLTEDGQLLQVRDSTLHLISCTVKGYDGNQVIVTQVPYGIEVVNQLLPGASEGMQVKILNK
ncbi:copper/silver efflux system membrane fusion protein CusB [Salinivirga cyanobacteriivorans]|uniref:Copper/silver efflux system membrane fusion protein CusB n=1 Tax=Salinivirga cyanobacteriivorans TaxID=1307839 RepID=A0A0S2I1G0_9BACT|nr:efflux RND transporter periplasmic adaptor subunit [Salinivirga cyanobacteriivorans]ALO16091.1 copper/silver efflux system membrane fusion protein CusB [Salinivirga cyanobacteriivorans]